MTASRNRRELQARYHRRAGVYDWICRPLYAKPRRAACEWIGEFLQPCTSPSLLIEIGCGTGLNLPSLRRAVPQSTTILGLDWTSSMLRKARARGEGAQLLQADPSAMQPGQADVVLLAYVLAVTPAWQQVLQQAQQLLRPGGALVILDTGRWQGKWRWCNSLLGPLVAWSGHADLDCPWQAALAAQSSMEVSYCGGMVRLWAGRPSQKRDVLGN